MVYRNIKIQNSSCLSGIEYDTKTKVLICHFVDPKYHQDYIYGNVPNWLFSGFNLTTSSKGRYFNNRLRNVNPWKPLREGGNVADYKKMYRISPA
jgi:hypothetical protein